MDWKQYFRNIRRKILYYIEEEGEITSWDIAEEFDMPLTTSSRRLAKMFRNGWLFRKWQKQGGYFIYRLRRPELLETY